MVKITPELRRIAERVICFQRAEDALRYPHRFLAYLMTYGTLEEVLIVRKYFRDEDFRAALLNAPPGFSICHLGLIGTEFTADTQSRPFRNETCNGTSTAKPRVAQRDSF